MDAGPEALQPAQALILELTNVLGLRLESRARLGGGEAAPFVELLLEIRAELRSQKLWALSDQVRDRLTELGVLIEDGKDGTTWRWK